jgi:hypothetical protein
MTRWDELTADAEDVLLLAAQGKRVKLIASELKQRGKTTVTVMRDGQLKTYSVSEHSLNHDILPAIYSKLPPSHRNLHGAAALYAHLLGMRGAFLHEEPEAQAPYTFGMGDLGKLTLPGCVISSQLENITATVVDGKYEPPAHLRGERLERMITKVKAQKEADGVLFFDGDILVADHLAFVDNLTFTTDLRKHVVLRLRHGSFFEYEAILRNFSADYHKVNPLQMKQPLLPHPVGTSLFIIAGTPPKLVLLRRSRGISGGGRYAATVQGIAESVEDVRQLGTAKMYEYLTNTFRELQEERTLPPLFAKELRSSITPFAMTYDYQTAGFTIHTYLKLPNANPEAIEQTQSLSKDGTYQLLDWPEVEQQYDHVNRVYKPKWKPERIGESYFTKICQHLVVNQKRWSAYDGIALVLLLERFFGKDFVHNAFKVPFLQQPR